MGESRRARAKPTTRLLCVSVEHGNETVHSTIDLIPGAVNGERMKISAKRGIRITILLRENWWKRCRSTQDSQVGGILVIMRKNVSMLQMGVGGNYFCVCSSMEPSESHTTKV